MDLERWEELGEALRASPARTVLTMAGVFWGMFVLVLMLGFSSGLESATERTLRGSSPNAVFIWGGRTRLPYKGLKPGRQIRYDLSDLAALREIPGISVLAPRNQLGGYRDGTPVVRGSESGAFQIMGDEPQVLSVLTIALDRGRFLNRIDEQETRKVAVIGQEVYRRLFPDGADPIGQPISIRGSFFEVVGLFRSTAGGDDGDRAESTIHVPFSTFRRAWNSGDQVQWFALTGAAGESGSAVEQRVKTLLAERHAIHPDDLGSIGSYNAEEEYARVQGLFRAIRSFVWIVGAATVLSGAVSVSNVLLIVVRERTHEIGLRRALGATRASIVAMIIQESLWMIGVSGGLGLVCGVGAVSVLGALIGPDHPSLGLPHIDVAAPISGFVLLAISGLAASVLPAQRAASLSPVDALRTE